MGERVNAIRRFIRCSPVNTIWYCASFGKLKAELRSNGIVGVKPLKFLRWHSGFNYFYGYYHGVKVFIKTCVEEYNTVLTEYKIRSYPPCENIPRAICYSDGPIPYVVTEFLELKNITKEMSEKEKKSVISQSVNILDFLFANGIIHRDIRPENLLIKNDGTVVLIDFGWAVYKSEMYSITDYPFIEEILNISYRKSDSFDDAYAMYLTLKAIFADDDDKSYTELVSRIDRLSLKTRL